MNIKVLVATHKNSMMPKDREVYLPIFVGKSIHPDVNHDFKGDNTGDNISLKNSSYNELTALYWAWKNLDADVIGLDHYRRYMSLNHKKDLDSVLTKSEIEEILKNVDVILPKERKYYIESNYSHYVHSHHSEPLDKTREIIERDYPAYLSAFDHVMSKTSAHMFNMFIMKKSLFNEYCTWLFDILGKVEEQVDTSNYDNYESRIYGFISELLLDVWLDTLDIRYKEVDFVYMEKQNWLVKGFSFLRRKFKPNFSN